MHRFLPALAALLLVALGGAWLIFNPSQPNLISAPAAAQDSSGGEGADVEVIPDYVLGNPDAPVTVIEYASYTCPHCANFHGDQFEGLKSEYIDTGKVRFIHREIYFDRYGLWGGLLAHCGGEMRYYGLSGMLYDKQEEWIGSGKEDEIIANLHTLGKTAGLSEDQIEACLTDDAMAMRLVETYQVNASAYEVSATPTLVIEGTKYSNMSFADMKEIIEAELAKKAE